VFDLRLSLPVFAGFEVVVRNLLFTPFESVSGSIPSGQMQSDAGGPRSTASAL
jgi:hypothetical protein